MYIFTDFHIPTFKGIVHFWVNIVPAYLASDKCFNVLVCSLNTLSTGIVS